jgi:hypothetical protein
MVFTLGMSVALSSCDEVLDYLGLNEIEVAQALKEALTVGSDTAVTRGSAINGYFGNQLIKILLPEEAATIVSVVSAVPVIGQPLINEVVLKMNRAAEVAAIEAKPILINALTGITITDAMGILNGNNNAATLYLKSATEEQIITAFRPHIQDALESVGAQDAWLEVTTLYNSISSTPVNTDLTDHTTRKATDGLFVMVAEEEGKIRENASHQVSDLLRRVFGGEN